jgi:23S rRNA pseudouridine1911/1915/1917 synthase
LRDCESRPPQYSEPEKPNYMSHVTETSDPENIEQFPALADESEQLDTYEARVPSSAQGQRMDTWLAQMQPQFSRSHWKKLIEAGQVALDGVAVKVPKAPLQAGQTVSATLEAPLAETSYTPEDVPLQPVYEDASVIVLNKAAGMVVHPAAGNWRGTVLNGLLHRWPLLAHVPRAGIVHRLDKDTSGLMVVAKDLQAQWSLVKQLQERTMSRRYYALVQGALPIDPEFEGRIEAAIGRDPIQRTRMAVAKDKAKDAKEAVTRYYPLAQGELDEKTVTLVRCELETGRTHQIRVHMAHVRHPLVGDIIYGGKPLAGFARQALHAAELSLEHPQSGETLSFKLELPEDMKNLLTLAGIKPIASK